MTKGGPANGASRIDNRLSKANRDFARHNTHLQQQSTHLHGQLVKALEENLRLTMHLQRLTDSNNRLHSENDALRSALAERANTLDLLSEHLRETAALMRMEAQATPAEDVACPTTKVQLKVVDSTCKRPRKALGDRSNTLDAIHE